MNERQLSASQKSGDSVDGTHGRFLWGGVCLWRGGLNHMARSWMSNDRLMAKRVFQVQVLH